MTKFPVITCEPLLGPPAVVPTFHNDVHFFKPVLSHVPTEDPASALVRDGVPSVHGTAPYVSDSIGIDGGVGPRLRHKWIVRGDSVPPAIGACPVHVNPQHFSQQGTSGRKVAKKQEHSGHPEGDLLDRMLGLFLIF